LSLAISGALSYRFDFRQVGEAVSDASANEDGEASKLV
jgi:hypothetical protein